MWLNGNRLFKKKRLSRFSEYLSRSNTCLIVNGYGFNDEHINKLIAGGLQNPTLQLIIYYPDHELEQQEEIKTPSRALNHLIKYNLPQLTVCFGNPRAHFQNFVGDLPEPALVDEQADKVRELVKLFVKLDKMDKNNEKSSPPDEEEVNEKR